MGIQDRIVGVLDQDMDRDEFLHHMGVALLQLFGLTALLRHRRAAR